MSLTIIFIIIAKEINRIKQKIISFIIYVEIYLEIYSTGYELINKNQVKIVLYIIYFHFKMRLLE